MINNGRHQYRFKSNPLEQAFAEEWDKLNTSTPGTPYTVLDYLLAENVERPAGEVSDRDREVAATVVQWLGSPVGKGFIQKVMPQ